MNYFRKEALESRFRKDGLAQINRDDRSFFKKILLIIALIFASGSIFAFFFFKIEFTIEAVGVLMPKNAEIHLIKNLENQYLKKIHIYDQLPILNNKILFEFNPSELQIKLESDKLLLEKLENRIIALTKLTEKSKDRRDNISLTKNQYLHNHIGSLNDEEKFLMHRLKAEENLAKQGFATKKSVADTRNQLIEIKAKRERMVSDLEQVEYEIIMEENKNFHEIDLLKYQIQELKNNINIVESKILAANIIRAKGNGIIKEIRVSEGEHYKEGEVIAEYLSGDFSEYEVICFIPIDQSKKISANSIAKIRLKNKIFKSFTSYKAILLDISMIPASISYVSKLIGDNSLTSSLIKQPVVIAKFMFQKDYNFTIQDIGTIADVEIVIAKATPFEILYTVKT